MRTLIFVNGDRTCKFSGKLRSTFQYGNVLYLAGVAMTKRQNRGSNIRKTLPSPRNTESAVDLVKAEEITKHLAFNMRRYLAYLRRRLGLTGTTLPYFLLEEFSKFEGKVLLNDVAVGKPFPITLETELLFDTPEAIRADELDPPTIHDFKVWWDHASIRPASVQSVRLTTIDRYRALATMLRAVLGADVIARWSQPRPPRRPRPANDNAPQ